MKNADIQEIRKIDSGDTSQESIAKSWELIVNFCFNWFPVKSVPKWCGMLGVVNRKKKKMSSGVK